MRLDARIVGLLTAGALAVPNAALAQDSELGLAVGDTVEFTIELDEFSGAWIGTVHEVKNPRSCIFVVHDKILRGTMFSMGIRFSDDFQLTRHSSTDGTKVITAAMLKEQGIDCIETHPTPHPHYLHPKTDKEKDDE